MTETPGSVMAQIELREIRSHQRNDPLIERWRRMVIDNYLPDKNQMRSKEDFMMRKHFQNFKILRGILYKEMVSENSEKIRQ